LKGHKLTLQVKDINAFDSQLIQGICTYIERQNVCDEEELEETREVLEAMAKKANSSFSQLRSIVIKESLARIQRDAKISLNWHLLSADWVELSIKIRRKTEDKLILNLPWARSLWFSG
jgi:hypothetical protein